MSFAKIEYSGSDKISYLGLEIFELLLPHIIEKSLLRA